MPGKTKHFQTLFWTPGWSHAVFAIPQCLFACLDIRLCDCPGLVMPNYAHLELQVRSYFDVAYERSHASRQVLCGILPITRVPSLPSCLHYVAERLPLEKVLDLSHPSPPPPPPAEDKRTWRPEQLARRAAEQEARRAAEEAANKERVWTAMDILTAFAERHGWLTAQVGRPDVMRAGNARKSNQT